MKTFVICYVIIAIIWNLFSAVKIIVKHNVDTDSDTLTVHEIRARLCDFKFMFWIMFLLAVLVWG
jgi:hypothetical protein